MNSTLTLDTLTAGQTARVVRISGQSIGRRLLDLGFIPGTPVRCVRKAPAGDPTAYAVRGAVVALRRGDAALVEVALAGPEQEADAS